MLGKLNANLGAGVSTLKIDDSMIEGPFIADTGAGADVMTTDTEDSNTGPVFLKPVTIDLGDGTLTLGGNGTSALVTAKSKFEADDGTGTNILTNSENKFAKLPVFVNLS